MTLLGRAQCALALALLVLGGADARAQDVPEAAATVASSGGPARTPGPAAAPPAGSVVRLYYDPAQGASSADLVRRALASNGELTAARLR